VGSAGRDNEVPPIFGTRVYRSYEGNAWVFYGAI